MAPTTQAAPTKVCTACGVEKPLDQFHRNAQCLHGRAPRCKPCVCRYVREHRAAHVEEHRARDRAEDRTEKRRAYWKARHVRRLGDERFQIQERAREAVKYALRAGRLKRAPCEACGAFETDAHHDDYSKPLVVRWLCRVCHAAHHKRQADAARATREVDELDRRSA